MPPPTPISDRLSDLSGKQQAWLQNRRQLYLLSRFGTRAQRSTLAGMQDPYESLRTLQDHLELFKAATRPIEMRPSNASPDDHRHRQRKTTQPADDPEAIPHPSSSWCAQDVSRVDGDPAPESSPGTLLLGCDGDMDRFGTEPLWQALLFASLVMTLLLASVWWWMHRKFRRRERLEPNEKRYTHVA